MEEVVVKTAGSYSFLGFLLRNWYWVLFIMITLPLLISSIKQAVDTQNPSYPFVEMGLRIFNADASLYNDVEHLQNNPSDFIGMEKPESGYFRTLVYYWDFFWNVIFRFLGFFVLIFFPFILFYKIFKMKDSTSTGKNLLLAIMSGIAFMFIFNLIMTIHSIVRGTISLSPPDADIFQEFWWIIKMTLPFHGLVRFIFYIISLF